jgi:hypothetical protein
MNPVQSAGEFLRVHGRDIDRARFAFHFGDGSRQDLIAALEHYQNDDGGFGHGLEVDIAAPTSNPFATELALLICLQAGVAPDHPLLARTVAYLERTQDQDGGWRFGPEIYKHELAPWFQGWQWPALNPTCTLAGLLKQLGLGSEGLHTRVEELFARLARPDDLLGDDFYSVRPYAYWFLPEQPHPQRELYISGVLWWLIRQHTANTIADGGHFFEYIRGPHTYTGRLLPAAILEQRLDQLAAEQTEDGGWPSPYAPAWRPWITVQNLLVLQRFGRLAAPSPEE